MTELVAGSAGILSGICLGTAVIYLLRVPARIQRGMRELNSRDFGAIALFIGAMAFVAWLAVPWLATLGTPGGDGPFYDWLTYALSLLIGVGFVEIAFQGGRRGWLGESRASEPEPAPAPAGAYR